ncbi:MAG TPA: ATP-binding protein [Lentisphaeria bacterium]|nr:MAG: ATPase [Lentisphaerae bacterium GWF2_49_21]HBC89273.1 ATP-binding protein [Lentisphaeria bacterium]
MKKDEKNRQEPAVSCPSAVKEQKCSGTADSLDAFLEQQKMDGRMQKIKHKIIVLSGKGGVGKSTVAVNLSISLSLSGKKVGLLDVDIHGPSIPKMLKLEDSRISVIDGVIQPVEKGGMKILSIGFLLHDRDDAVIWRGPMKAGVIKQFLSDVAWGELDYLIIDSPPGTGDEPLSVCQMLKNPDGAVIVTTPQDVAIVDVRKSINFCRQLKIPVIGVIENMSGFVCPKCGEITQIFKTGGGEKMAVEMKVPFLGRIPIDSAIGVACDAGTPFIYHYNKTETGKAFEQIIEPILALTEPEKAVS